MKSHRLVRCPACGFVHVDSTCEEQLASFYERDYFEGRLANGFGFEGATETDPFAGPVAPEAEWVISRRLDPLGAQAVLEVGPGVTGGWIKRFTRDPHVRTQCVEISRLASEHLNRSGIPTFNGTIEEFRSESPFDLAIAVEVIEHVADPLSFATKVREHLAPDGHFFLSTGNARSLTARRHGLDWYYLDPPAHLSYFNDRNIEQLLRRAGFDRVSVSRFGFKCVGCALRYRIPGMLGVLHALNYASGMLVLAHKPEAPALAS